MWLLFQSYHSRVNLTGSRVIASGSLRSAVDTTQNWSFNQWRNYRFVNKTNGIERLIVSNTPNTLQFAADLDIAPSGSNHYQIIVDDDKSYINGGNFATVGQFSNLNNSFYPSQRLDEGVAEQKGKNRKISSHYAQLHHPDFAVLNNKGKTEALASITLSNSCNGAKPLNMDLGAFRLVCSNGAVRFDRAAESSIKHTEINYRELPQFIAKLNNKAMVLAEEINSMKHKQLSIEEMKKFAYEAARLRFDDMTNVNIEDILRVNRIEDESNDVWTVFNRIQESLTHDVTNFNQDILLNKQLFSLADQYALAV